MKVKTYTLMSDTLGKPLSEFLWFESQLQMMYSHPMKVTVAALLEVGREDLLKYVGSFGEHYVNQDPLNSGKPHLIDDNFDSTLPLEDWALIEKAMQLGYKAFNLTYSCYGCEILFNDLGVQHGFEND